MSGIGTESKITIRAAGTPVPARGKIQLSEDVRSGVHFACQLDAEPDTLFRPGDPIVVVISTDRDDTRSAEHHLWCCDVLRQTTTSGSLVVLEGTDPFSFCASSVQFRTWQGARPLAQIISDVLALQPGALPSMPAMIAPTPSVKQEWLFQCCETGYDFLSRLAGQSGQIIYWDRKAFASGDIGSGPGAAGGTFSLDFESGLISFDVHSAPGCHTSSLAWTDAVTAKTQRLDLKGTGIPGVATRSTLHNRVSAAQRPTAAAYAAVNGLSGAMMRASAVTTRPDLRLGSIVKLPDGTTMMIQHIDHFLSAHGSYANEISCLPRDMWGLGSRTPRHCLTGPFLGKVTDNNDPVRQGRIRITLVEEAERRTSHWIPVAQISSGPALGMHWIPEKDDLVLLIADADCPENLQCIGSVRGESQKIDDAWSSGTNATKVLEFRNGTRLRVNDEQGTLLLESGSSSLLLDSTGEITIKGKRLKIETNETTEIQGGQHVKIDAQRIDLG